jgi:ribonuclease HII
MSNMANNEEDVPKKISHIKLEFMQADDCAIPALLKKYGSDERSGVITICNQYRNKLQSLEKEMNRLAVMKQYENKYKDYQYICGIDEVGRGPFAGPVEPAR